MGCRPQHLEVDPRAVRCHLHGFRIVDIGIQGLRIRVWGLGFRGHGYTVLVLDLGQSVGCRVSGLGFRI